MMMMMMMMMRVITCGKNPLRNIIVDLKIFNLQSCHRAFLCCQIVPDIQGKGGCCKYIYRYKYKNIYVTKTYNRDRDKNRYRFKFWPWCILLLSGRTWHSRGQKKLNCGLGEFRVLAKKFIYKYNTNTNTNTDTDTDANRKKNRVVHANKEWIPIDKNLPEEKKFEGISDW